MKIVTMPIDKIRFPNDTKETRRQGLLPLCKKCRVTIGADFIKPSAVDPVEEAANERN